MELEKDRKYEPGPARESTSRGRPASVNRVRKQESEAFLLTR